MSSPQQNPEKSISTRLFEILDQLNVDQIRFVVARQEYPTKKAAAMAIDLEPDTVYHWPKTVDEAATLFALDVQETARQIRKKNLIKAMVVKVSGLNAKEEPIRQRIATEIIEAELGRPIQHRQVGTTEGEPIEIILNWSDGGKAA